MYKFIVTVYAILLTALFPFKEFSNLCSDRVHDATELIDNVFGTNIKEREIEKQSEKTEPVSNHDAEVSSPEEEEPKYLPINTWATPETISMDRGDVLKYCDKITVPGISTLSVPNFPIILYMEDESQKIGIYSYVCNYVIVPAQFDDAFVENFNNSDGIVILSLNGKWGALSFDSTGSYEIRVPFQYQSLTPFRNGKTTALTFENEPIVLDANGRRIE